MAVEGLEAPMFPQLLMSKMKNFSSEIQMWDMSCEVFSCVFLTNQGSLG